MMGKHLFSAVSAFVVMGTTFPAQAQESGVGAGVVIGEPTGLCLKAWVGKHTAFDAGLALAFTGQESSLHLHADYLAHHFGILKPEKGTVALYYGLGARMKLEEESRVGARVPLGLAYLFADVPLDIFLEISPILDLVPRTDVSINAGIGIRYFF